MVLREVLELLDAEVLTEDVNYDMELSSAFSSDVMDDVLAYSHDKSILITAICDAIALRTADLLRIPCIILIGTKRPDESLTELANSLGLTLIHSHFSMYVTCGKLYASGLIGTTMTVE